MRNSVLISAGTALAAGVLSTVSATPVQAQSASFAGSATLINPSSLTTTVSAERVVAGGREFTAGTAFVVTPIANVGGGIGFGNGSVRISSLNLGVLNTEVPTPLSSFTAAAANALTQVVIGASGDVANNAEAIAAIIKAGAGVDGLD